MSIQTIEFGMMGRKYRTRQFSAVQGLEILRTKEEIHPLVMLSQTYIFIEGEWIKLSSREAVNDHVADVLNLVAPYMALKGLVGIVHDKNFGFIPSWKSIRIPSRFAGGHSTVQTENADPMISQIIQDGRATMRELEKYYSVEDAFKLFDIMISAGVNEALAGEAATKKTRR